MEVHAAAACNAMGCAQVVDPRTTVSSSPRSSGTVTLDSDGSACREAEYAPSVSTCETTLSAITIPPGSSSGSASAEERLVVVLLGIEEHEVEGVLDRGERRFRIALDELGPLLEPGVGDVRAPRLALDRIVLERHELPAENRAPAASQIDE